MLDECEYEREGVPADRHSADVPADRRSADVSADLSAEELQELYEEQMRRMACPSCGEEAFLG